MRRLIFALALLAPQLAKGADAIIHRASPGGTFCAVIENATDSATVDFVYVSGRKYVITEANLVTATLASGNFSGEVFATTAALVNVATDEPVGTIGFTGWNGVTVTNDFIATLLNQLLVGYSIEGSVGEAFNAIENITGGILTDVDQEPIPAARVFILARDEDDGLVAENGKGIKIGENPTIAVDFKGDLPANGRILTVSTPTIDSGTAGGITFNTVGRDKTQAKFRPTGVTAGTYSVGVTVTTDSSPTLKGTVVFTVTP